MGVGSVTGYQEGGRNFSLLLFVGGGGQLRDGERDMLQVPHHVNIFSTILWGDGRCQRHEGCEEWAGFLAVEIADKRNCVCLQV